MTLWVAWSLLATALVAGAAAAVERVVTYAGGARRVVWAAAIALAVGLPLALALREPRPVPTPAAGAAPSRTNGPTVVDVAVVRSWPSLVRRADVWVARGWGAASAVLLALLLRALAELRRRAAQWDEEETDVGRVLVSRDTGPAVVGVVRPRVVLPRWALTADRATRERLLRHEVEHVRAGDTRTLLAAEIAIVLCPWNAALWWMVRRLRLAVEIDCDARVVRSLGDAHGYGLTLLAAAERHAVALPLAASLSEPPHTLAARIHAMTTPARRRPLVASLPYAAVAAVVLSTTAWMPRPAPLGGPVVAAPSPKPLRGNAAPKYPASLRADGVEGRVIVEFATAAGGVPDAASIRLVEATHALFGEAVRAVIPTWRFDGAGTVRLAVRFMTADTEAKELAGQRAPTFDDDPGSLSPIVVVTRRP